MTSPLAVCWFWVRLSACLHCGALPRYTDRDGGGDRRRVKGNQAVYHTSPLHYHAERYTWGLSHCPRSSPAAPGPTDGSFWAHTDGSISVPCQRERLQLQFIAPQMWSIMERAEEMHSTANHMWTCGTQRTIYGDVQSFCRRFVLQVRRLYPDSCYHMKDVLYVCNLWRGGKQYCHRAVMMDGWDGSGLRFECWTVNSGWHLCYCVYISALYVPPPPQKKI